MSGSDSELIDEELTAYLDGELSPPQSSALEQRLVEDMQLRQRLAELRHSYDLLDELPETPHNQSFTQSTIAMVVEDVRKSAAPSGLSVPSESALPNKGWFAWPKIMVPLGVMLALGCMLGAMAAILQTRFELSNLGLIANLSGLKDVGELKVAQELAKENELIDYLGEKFSDRTIPLIPSSLWTRRSWFISLNPTQISRLESGREQLLKLPMESILRLEAIQSQVDSHADANAINQTLRVIGNVLDALPSSKRQDLEGLSNELRIRFLREQLCFRAAMFYAADLSNEDVSALELWSKNELLPILITSMPFLRREDDVRMMLMSLYSLRPIEDGFRIENQDELVSSLANSMSPFARKLLEGIDRNDQLIVIATWLVPEGINNHKRLIDAYEGMKRELRDEIDLADPIQSKRMLRERSRRPNATNRNR